MGSLPAGNSDWEGAAPEEDRLAEQREEVNGTGAENLSSVVGSLSFSPAVPMPVQCAQMYISRMNKAFATERRRLPQNLRK